MNQLPKFNTYDRLYKIIIVGDASIGKSSLVQKYTTNDFNPDESTTIGVEFAQKFILYNNLTIKLQLWDTAGQEIYRSICRSYFNNASGIIICFDLTNVYTFYNVSKWISEVTTQCSNSKCIVFVGTKSDKYNRQVNDKMIKELLIKYNFDYELNYIEVSSKKNINIEECFLRLIKIIDDSKSNYIQNKGSIELENNQPSSRYKRSNCFIC